MTNDNRNQTTNTMNNTTAHSAHAGSTIQPITIRRFIVFTILTLALLAFTTTAPLHAQPATPAPDALPSASETSAFSLQPSALAPSPQAAPVDTSVLQPLFDGLLGKYGCLTTALLAIGSLRILFKPVMLVVENALKNDPAKYAAIQRFEAGPVYKVIATVLDVGASIKLPLVKPPPGK